MWWASDPEWLRELDGWHDLGVANLLPMIEGTLHFLCSDRDEVTLSAYRGFAATSQAPSRTPRTQRAAWRGFTITDHRSPIAATNSTIATTTSRARLPAPGRYPGTTARLTARPRTESGRGIWPRLKNVHTAATCAATEIEGFTRRSCSSLL